MCASMRKDSASSDEIPIFATSRPSGSLQCMKCLNRNISPQEIFVSRASRCLNEASVFADVNASGSLVHVCKVEWSLRIYKFLHECPHSFQHYAAHMKIYHQHGEGEDLINEEVILTLIHFKYEYPFSQRISIIQTLIRICQF